MPLSDAGLLLAQVAAAPDAKPGVWVFVALMVFIAASVWLGTLAQSAMSKQKFLEGFFLGGRGLGAWALALTATVQSGGTFMGFPSLVYTHGWIVTLWIGSYMVVPLTGFTILGKRLSQLSRRCNAVTVPDLLRTRFNDPRVGLTASLIILLSMSIMMVAQFKAGAIVMQLSAGNMMAFSEDAKVNLDTTYYVGLAIFSLTVIGYTMIGGFLASVWTDLFQSVLMFFGVMILLMLALSAVAQKTEQSSWIGGMEQATKIAVDHTSMAYASGPGYIDPRSDVQPGHEFLPVSLAISFFFVWVWGGWASPASMVRVMAASNTEVMRKSIFLLSCYNCCIYVPLIIICICGRTIFPDIKAGETDKIVPLLAINLTQNLPGGSMIAALILAAPFGAIMATVSCYLLVIASGLVQDIYLRFINPNASTRQLRLWTNVSMISVGLAAILANIKPPPYLQALVVLSTSVAAAALAIPMLMACYWRKATPLGTVCAMLSGSGVVLILVMLGLLQALPSYDEAKLWYQHALAPLGELVRSQFGTAQAVGNVSGAKPYFLFSLEPVVWGLLASAITGVGVSLVTKPPREDHLAKFFDVPPAK